MNIAILIVGVMSILLGVSYYLGYMPGFISVMVLCLSLISYFYYAKDKKAAVSGAWRVPENTLHVLAVAGGWPGALLAQRSLRHKTKKVSFRVVFWFTVLANVFGLVWLHSSDGQIKLQTAMRITGNVVNATLDSEFVLSSVSFLTTFRDKK